MTLAEIIPTTEPALHIDGRRALSVETVEAVVECCDRIAEDPGTAPALLYVTGGPDGAARTGTADLALVGRWERALRRLERAPRASIAIITGDCAGTALDVSLVADVRIAVRGARLIPPGPGGAGWSGMALYRLARYADAAPVRRAVLLGTPIVLSGDGADEVSDGVVDEIVEDLGDALAAVARLAAALTGIVGTELAIRRQLLQDAGHTRFEDALGAHLAACDRALRRAAHH